MKAFVINLDKNQDRLHSITCQLAKCACPFERFPAVWGKALSSQERRSVYAGWRVLCALGYAMSDGQLGCALSHLGVYSRMMQDGIDVALVLEDDIILSEKFMRVLGNVENFLNPKEPQVVLLSAWQAKPVEDETIESVRSAGCTDAYVITLPAARIIYKLNFPVVTVADRWSRWRTYGGVQLYRAYPTTVVQDNAQFGSDIDMSSESGVARNVNRRIGRLVVWKVFRLIGVSIDWLIWRIKGR